MRIFKFRVWDKEDKIFWNTDDGWYFYKGLPEFAVAIGGFFGSDRFIVQQFTGLKDKNSKEICEGDIVRYSNSRDNMFEMFRVEYSDKEARFKLINSNYDFSLYERDDYYGHITVVGDGFEHP